MSNIVVGMLAKSLAGHDKGSVYLIQYIEGEYVYLVDGKLKTIEKPKKKKQKHIQIIKTALYIEETQNDDIKKLIIE